MNRGWTAECAHKHSPMNCTATVPEGWDWTTGNILLVTSTACSCLALISIIVFFLYLHCGSTRTASSIARVACSMAARQFPRSDAGADSVEMQTFSDGKSNLVGVDSIYDDVDLYASTDEPPSHAQYPNILSDDKFSVYPITGGEFE